DAWTAFDLGGEANVEKAIRLMKESLELVDLAANRRGLKTFEEELEASRNPAPTPPKPQPAPSAPQPTPPEPSPVAPSVAWTEAHTAGTQKSLEIEGATYNFRYCPAGTFTMGSPTSEPERYSDETQHEVTLTQGFWMLETEVTQALWESVTGKNPMTIDAWKGPNKPVGNVSWEDCQEFIEKLNSLGIAPAGLKFRLPTEAEWEYACRAGTSGPYAGSSFRFDGLV
ncbi:MAG: formylglycine-generating enzyme family protein, partial [Thermoguttaceae bacterium]|nr:formylglycine-generating enzyme family protein [Thermoguttaceae bacterium]